MTFPDFLSRYSLFGFAGSRFSGGGPVASVLAHGAAYGADGAPPVWVPSPSSSTSPAASVLKIVPGARVFYPPAGLWGGRALAARASAFCHALADVPGSILICFPLGGCPDGLAPSRSWPARSGSGSWSELALVAGRGGSVVVAFPPRSPFNPPHSWGNWIRVYIGPGSGPAFLLSPAVEQLVIFGGSDVF